MKTAVSEKYKHIAVLVTTALVAVFFILLSVPFVRADNVRADNISDAEHILVLDDFDEENKWLASHNIAEMGFINQQYGNETRSCLEVKPDSMTQQSSVIRMFSSAVPLNLYDYSKISYKLYIAKPDSEEGDTISSEDVKEEYTVIFTVHSGTYKSEHISKISAGVWYTIKADISDWFRRGSVNAIEVTVYPTSQNSEITHGGYFLVDSISAWGVSDTSVSDTFLSNNFEGTGCEVSYSNDNKTMIVSRESPDVSSSSSSSYINGNISVKDRSSLGGFNAIRIVLENPTDCESLKLEYASETDSLFTDAKSVTTPINKNSQKTSYLLFITPDVNLDSLKLTFSGSWSGDIKISAISLVTIKDGFEVSDGLQIGNISKCEMSSDEKYITVRGTVESDMAVKYIDCRLNLYEIPSYGDVTQITVETEPVMTLDMSTRFEFRLPADGRESVCLTHKYVVALVYHDELIFADNPKYVTNPQAIITAAASHKQDNKSMKGFFDSDITGIFEAGCAEVVIEIPIDALIVPKNEFNGAGKLYVRDGYYYYFNSSYINYLDSRIKMYSMSGSDVILRLVSLSGKDGEAEYNDILKTSEMSETDAVYYAFDTNSSSAINQLCAVVDYLSGRYNGTNGEGRISGFIVGYKADVFSVYNNAGTVSDNIYNYVKSYADSLRIIYSVASRNISEIKVYASTGEYVYKSDRDLLNITDSGYDILTGISDMSIDPALFVELLCRRIGEEGAFPWYLMNEGSGAGDSHITAYEYGRTMNFLISRMTKKYVSYPVASSILWEPESEYYMESGKLSVSYVELFRLSVSEKCADSVILSLVRQNGSEEIFSDILPMLKSIDSQYEKAGIKAQREFIASDAEVVSSGDKEKVHCGSYAFWDFTQAYDAQGWFAGEGASSVSTGKNSLMSHRALIAEMTGAEKGLCSVMMWAAGDRIKNLSYTPVIETELMITSKTSETDTFEIVMVFGSDMGRAEYTAEIQSGALVSLRTDLSEFSSKEKISYIAVMVRGEEASSVYIGKISGFSETYANDELKNLIENYSDENIIPSDDTDMMMIIAIAFVSIFTLASILLLSRRKDDL